MVTRRTRKGGMFKSKNIQKKVDEIVDLYHLEEIEMPYLLSARTHEKMTEKDQSLIDKIGYENRERYNELKKIVSGLSRREIHEIVQIINRKYNHATRQFRDHLSNISLGGKYTKKVRCFNKS